MDIPVSPLAPKLLASLPALKGVKMATRATGSKYVGRDDLLLMVFDKPAQAAGVFTKSACPSAPVDWCRNILASGTAKALVVNAGNANAFTGKRGAEATKATAEMAANSIGCRAGDVFLASTGVIGEPLDPEPFKDHLIDMHAGLDADGWASASGAILTTDTFAKRATQECTIKGQTYTINGIAKGSGMIAPDMATMLAFIVTDAPVTSVVLQALLSRETEVSFNAITVDSDTSTSDTVLAFATGAEDYVPLLSKIADPALEDFKTSFSVIMKDLAMQVVRDGEGATKQISITVRGAVSDASARNIALSVANSPLVKTAVAGEDANWGRVVMAVGKAGEIADRDRLSIWFGDIRVSVDGERDPDYSEDVASAYMKHNEIDINIDIGLGDGSFTVWTCDLTKQYVAINGDYRS